MNIKPIAILAVCTFLIGGCGKSSTPPTTTSNNNSQSPPAPIQAEPFHGQVYKSLDGRTTLTLVSKDECELSEGGTILLCKYTKPNDTLRVVTTTLGTSQVIYFRFTDQGLRDNNGNILYSQEQYAAILQRQLEEKRQAENEKRNANVETKTIATYNLTPIVFQGAFVSDTHVTPDQLVLTDVSLKFHFPQSGDKAAKNETVYFSTITELPKPDPWSSGAYGFTVRHAASENEVPSHEEATASQSDVQIICASIANAYSTWKAKFPDAASKSPWLP